MQNYQFADYATWLTKARLAVSKQQQTTSIIFSEDSTSVSFDNISYATCKVLSEHQPEQE